MHAEWGNTQLSDLQPSVRYPVDRLPPRANISTISAGKPPRPNTKTQPQSHKNNARSRSCRRRYHSISSNRSARGEKRIIVMQQPGGWYQVNHVTRNLSLAPGPPAHEPLMAYSFAGDQATDRRKMRRKRRRANKWQCQNRFPSPSVFRTALGILREMPCARMHYNSFKRMFPTMPTRTEKERRFRLEAAREMPFAKYPNEQLLTILQTSSSTETTTSLIHNKINMCRKTPTEPQVNTDRETGGDMRLIEEKDSINANEDTHSESTTETSDESDSDNDPTDDEFRPLIRSNAPREQQELESKLSESAPQVLATLLKSSPVAKVDSLSIGDAGQQKTIQIPEASGLNPAPDHEPSASYETPSSADPSDPCQGTNFSTALLYRMQNSEPERSDSISHWSSETKSHRTSSESYEKRKAAQKSLPPSLCRMPRARPHMGGIECSTCGHAAYPAERLEADGLVFHMNCFRCHQCGTMLQRAAWNQHGTHYLCNPCHRRIALQTLRH